jgi:flagellar basal body rod protein FlgG
MFKIEPASPGTTRVLLHRPPELPNAARQFRRHAAETRRAYAPGMDGMTWMASAMRAAQAQLDTATQNLANVSSDGFRRVRSVLTLTPGGLRVSESRDMAQGGIRQTGRALDLALLGPGAFRLAGGVATRDGAFIRNRDGLLANQHGRLLLGDHGPIPFPSTATVDADGTIRDGTRTIARLALPGGTTVRSGALEESSVDAIGETLAILTAQRAFETAQKTLVAIDQTREKAVNDVVRLK